MALPLILWPGSLPLDPAVLLSLNPQRLDTRLLLPSILLLFEPQFLTPSTVYAVEGVRNGGDGGGGHWLVWMEWCPARWSVCLPLLIFPCTIKSRSSFLALTHPGGPGKRGQKTVVCVCLCVPLSMLPSAVST